MFSRGCSWVPSSVLCALLPFCPLPCAVVVTPWCFEALFAHPTVGESDDGGRLRVGFCVLPTPVPGQPGDTGVLERGTPGQR